MFVNYVPKPWGREYLCWESKDCAIWLLEIKSHYSTSFHCHAEKNTGLVILDGEVNLELINSSFLLKRLDKINIFRGRFHKSTAASNADAVILEVEAPVNKGDLIRWNDDNGRKNSNYEEERVLFGAGDAHLELGTNENYKKISVMLRKKYKN